MRIGREMARKSVQGLIGRPIREGERGVEVKRALEVPNDIIRPDYILEPGSGFGIYEGKSTVHDKQTVDLLRKSG